MTVVNIFSIDLEEVFHAEYIRPYIKDSDKVYSTPLILQNIIKFLAIHNVEATFFIVGEIAEKFPWIIKILTEKGHEVAFHGWSHEPLWKLNYQSFRKELMLFKRLHPKCIGFRAPSFSINNKTKWALNLLEKMKFKYDSSVFPTWTPLYGIYKAPIKPYIPNRLDISKESKGGIDGYNLIEFPLAVYKLWNIKILLRFRYIQYYRKNGSFWRLGRVPLYIPPYKAFNTVFAFDAKPLSGAARKS